MGHIVNATAFRLGRSVKHKTILSNKLDNRYLMYYQRNLLILQFIKTFFSAYAFTASSENPRKLTEENINENFLKRLTTNYFVSNSFLFSHASIQRASSLIINVHMYDSGLEKIRTRMYQFVKYAPHTFFKPQKEKRNWAKNILNLAKPSKYLYKNRWIKKLKIPFKFFSKRYFLPPRKKRVRYLYVMKTKKQRWWPKSRKYFTTRSSLRYKFWKKDIKYYPKPTNFFKYPKLIKNQYYRGPNTARMTRFFPMTSVYPGNKMKVLITLAPRKRFLIAKTLCKLGLKKNAALAVPTLRFLIQGFVRFTKPKKRQVHLNWSKGAYTTKKTTLAPKGRSHASRHIGSDTRKKHRIYRTKSAKMQLLLFKILYSLRIKEYTTAVYKLFFFRKIIKLRLAVLRSAFEIIRGTLVSFEGNLDQKLKIGFHVLQYRTITALQICNFI